MRFMEETTLDTTSLWKKISDQSATYPALNKDIEVDIAIIGAGITGITTAFQLINAGKKVAILEAGKVGGVTTSSSTGNLYIAVQPYYQNIQAKFNFETAKTIAHSRKFAIDYIEKNIQEKNINCNFSRRPWYAYTANNEKVALLEKEVELLKKMEIDIDYTDHLPLSFKFIKAAVMENQARFNPLQYVISMAAALKEKGCLIFEDTRVIDQIEKDVCTLKTAAGHSVIAKKVVMATHTPIGVNAAQFFTAPYRSYIVAVRLKDNQYPEGHFWDLDCPHHASCTHATASSHQLNLLMVAGDHHKVGQGGEMSVHYENLESFLREHFAVAEVAYRWSAQHYQAADDVPYIGLASRFAKHTYLATGFFADGLVYGTIAGILVGDLILEKENSWEKIYSANRFTPIASGAFVVKEDVNYFAQYYKDFPECATTHFDQIKKGEGKVVEIDREKWGVYKDDQEKLHVVSAVCTHMKCIVNWNNAEKTWDCPCHGSRFTTEGKVIEGPAKLDLKKKEL